jgi:mRNA interferase RelE/StbE
LKLKGLEATYRIRIGNYRLVYEIDDVGRVVLISRVRHRGEAYE